MNTTDVVILNTDKISRDEIKAAYFLMSAQRREKCDRFLRDEDKILCIVSDMLLRRELSQKTGILSENIEFIYGENGKPYLKNREYFFSVSHAGNMVAAAFNKDNEVGIDIEKIRPMKAGTLKFFCTDKDRDFIFSSASMPEIISEAESLDRIFRVWTFKEAYVKTVGGRFFELASSVSFDAAKCREGLVDDYRFCVITASNGL